MEGWQIVLICSMAIVIGVGVGLAVDYLIRRYRRKRAPALAPAGESGQVVPPVKGERKKPSATMVPLLSRRSLIGLAIGLAIGVGLGLGYWAISPLNLEIKAGWPPIEFGNNPQPYESIAYVQVMNPGASVVPLETLRRQAEYYVAKLNTSPFFQFVSEKLAEQAPQYPRSANDLAKAINIDVRYEDITTNIRVRATSQTPAEALFLASVTQHSFQEYLTTEQLNIEKEAYQSKLNEIESAKTALLEAQNRISQIVVGQRGSFELTTDPQYIALSARIEALQRELTKAADEMAALIAQGDSGADYIEAVQAVERASEALGRTRQDITILKAQSALRYFEDRLAYTEANTTVERLSQQLNDLIAGLGSPPSSNPEATETSYFSTSGEPSNPEIVPLERIRGRSALMMGALLGLGVAWVVLNRRWLVKQVSSSREEVEESTT